MPNKYHLQLFFARFLGRHYFKSIPQKPLKKRERETCKQRADNSTQRITHSSCIWQTYWFKKTTKWTRIECIQNRMSDLVTVDTKQNMRSIIVIHLETKHSKICVWIISKHPLQVQESKELGTANISKNKIHSEGYKSKRWNDRQVPQANLQASNPLSKAKMEGWILK